MRSRLSLLPLLSLCLAACGGGTTVDAGADAARPDGGTVDLGAHDGGPDTGTADLGSPDLGADLGPPTPCATPVLPALTTEDIAAGHSFDNPIFVTQAPGDDALYVVEQTGTIQIVRGGVVNAAPFIDLGDTTMGAGGEQGLLGLAFHPDYATNGRFFVDYTPNSPSENIVAEYHRSDADHDVADLAAVHVLVHQADPEGNHNGGWIGFGPDRFLYVAIGDGGGGCDGHGTIGSGQDKTTLLGKMLRLDVDNTAGMYAAAGNPFGGATDLPQIWAWGLRNPWRDSFDQRTGDLYIGDVGQNAWEEVDFQPASSTGGENYGWRLREGTHSSDDSGCSGGAAPAGAIEPITDYDHSGGRQAVTGGYVYRGTALPSLDGVYFYGDYGSGEVWALRYCEGAIHGPVDVPDLNSAVGNTSSFGQDRAGEIYMVGIGGSVAKIVPGP